MHSLINERFMNKAGFTCLVTLEELFLKNLKMYEVSPRYVQYLSAYQEHLFTTSGEKASRKYIGVILEINNFKYFAPLSSFKEKHKKMSEGVDFIKLKNYAVLNINNMIPVPEGEFSLVDINGTKDQHYRYLMQAELREINRQKNRIYKNASIVYNHKLLKGNSTPLAKRTNNFAELERRYMEFT